MPRIFRRRSSPGLLQEEAEGSSNTVEKWTPKLILSVCAITMSQLTICSYLLQWSCIAKIAPEITAYNKTEFKLAFSFYGVSFAIMFFIPTFMRNTQKDRISDRFYLLPSYPFKMLSYVLV